MRVIDLLRMWVAEVIFKKQLIIVARVPYPQSQAALAAISRQTRQHTGYETVCVQDRASTGTTFEFLPVRRAPALFYAQPLSAEEQTAILDKFEERQRTLPPRAVVLQRKPLHIPVG